MNECVYPRIAPQFKSLLVKIAHTHKDKISHLLENTLLFTHPSQFCKEDLGVS